MRSQAVGDPLSRLRATVEEAAAALRDGSGEASAPTLERPPRPDLGDYSTNAAMLLAPVLGESPRAIAQRLVAELESGLGPRLERAEVAGPGFLNLFLADAWFRDALAHLLRAEEGFGGAVAGAAGAERILIEFVSANPTGPLTAAGGRHAAFGDSLARVLALAGHSVEREYTVNADGTQLRPRGESVRARARGEEVPEGGYEGEYVRELAERIPGAADRDPDDLARRAVVIMVEQIRASLHRYRVDFDTWFSERSLHEGSVHEVLAQLERSGRLYRHEDAEWLRTTDFGDDKDRVLRRQSGELTYFASDIAHHEHKRKAGFDRYINVLGADHHGYVRRMKAAWEALGDDPDRLELLIMQFVNVVEGGSRASMSKRRGDFVTLDELVDEIGVDAARFFLLQRSHDTTVDLDIDLAREESNENPVYYVQYAHARIASVLAKAGPGRVAEAVATAQGGATGGELEPAERALLKRLLAFAGEVAEAAARRAPHRIAAYALELAQDFTIFYRDCRVVGAEPREVESFRLALSVASKRTIAQALDLLGVAAPESM